MSQPTCLAQDLQLKPRVLLADDHSELLDAIARLLSESCDVVGCVADGLQVLESASQLRPDVVVVDVHMPGMNGLEVCRRLRAALPRVKIILFSASDDASVRSSAMGLGASAFVVKYRAGFDLVPAIDNALANEKHVPSRVGRSHSKTDIQFQ